MAEQITGVYIPTGRNPYGFQLNINHPRINALYRKYKAWKGLPENFPISDEQRREFESYVLPKLRGDNPPLK